MKIRNTFYRLLLGAVAIVALASVASAGVTAVYYDLSHPTGNQGTSHTYGTTPYELPIYGYMTNVAEPVNVGATWTPGGTTTDLYGKVTNGDPGETGLGMAHDPYAGATQHEIWDYPGTHSNGALDYGFLVIDTYNLQQNSNLLYFHIQIGSAQDKEWWTVYTSSGLPGTSGGVGTLRQIAGVNNPQEQSAFFTIPGWNSNPDNRYVWVGAIIEPSSGNDHSNVVLDSEVAFNNNPNGLPPLATPEPGTLAMLGTGVMGLAGVLRRKLF